MTRGPRKWAQPLSQNEKHEMRRNSFALNAPGNMKKIEDSRGWRYFKNRVCFEVTIPKKTGSLPAMKSPLIIVKDLRRVHGWGTRMPSSIVLPFMVPAFA